MPKVSNTKAKKFLFMLSVLVAIYSALGIWVWEAAAIRQGTLLGELSRELGYANVWYRLSPFLVLSLVIWRLPKGYQSLRVIPLVLALGTMAYLSTKASIDVQNALLAKKWTAMALIDGFVVMYEHAIGGAGILLSYLVPLLIEFWGEKRTG